jgi:regulator of sirC expression with transglutaminase-like and TPR domain
LFVRLTIALLVLGNAGCDRTSTLITPAVEHSTATSAEMRLQVARRLLDQPEDQIDLANAKLTIKQLDAIAAVVKSQLSANASSGERVEALREYLYKPNEWNGGQPFHYDLDDPMGHDIHNKLLSTYLATRKGNCISMPLLFIVVGQKLGLDVTAATAPSHVFVKYRDESGTYYNLETTSGAGFTSDAWIQKQIPMTAEALANGVYLRPLSKKETVALMLGTVMEYLGQQGQPQEELALAELVLGYSPRNVEVMLHIHGSYGRIIQQEFASRWARPRDIPMSQRGRFIELDRNGMFWRQRAEALGWRQPSDDEEDAYRQRIKLAKSTH